MANQSSNPRQQQTGPAPKILRIGVILGEKIVEERLVRNREPVTIGQSAKNTFAVPTPDLPKSWPLFQLAGGRYVLTVSDNMDGRLSDGGQVQTIAQLKQSGRAQRSGSGWQIPLSENARGKITVGDMTLLFQFVVAPPLQPRPQLPHSVRGSIADSIDPYLAVVLAISLLFHGLAFVYFYFIMDPKAEEEIDEIPEQFARATMDNPELMKKALPPVEEAKGPEEAPVEEKKEEGKKENKKDLGEINTASDKPSAEQKVKNTAVMRVLGTAGGGGSFFDVSGGKDIGGDLDKGLARVGAAGEDIAAVGGGGSLEGGVRGGGAGGGIAEGKQTGVAGPTGPKNTGGEKAEKEVKGTGSASDFEGDTSGSLDPDTFAQTLKKRWYPQAVACYERELKTNPTIGGKVEVSLTVGVGGNVTKITVNGFNANVDACIEGAARRSWRFPKPEEPSTFDFSFVFRKAN